MPRACKAAPRPSGRSSKGVARPDLAELLASIAAGDKTAFARLYASTSSKLYGVALGILRDHAMAEDVLQEAYLRVWRHAARFDPSIASPITWMATIVRNGAIDLLRKGKPQPLVGGLNDAGEIPSSDTLLFDESDIARRRAIAFSALKKLDPKRRQLILQAYIQQQTRRELAGRWGVPIGTLKTNLRRSLIALRQSIEREQGGALLQWQAR